MQLYISSIRESQEILVYISSMRELLKSLPSLMEGSHGLKSMDQLEQHMHSCTLEDNLCVHDGKMHPCLAWLYRTNGGLAQPHKGNGGSTNGP